MKAERLEKKLQENLIPLLHYYKKEIVEAKLKTFLEEVESCSVCQDVRRKAANEYSDGYMAVAACNRGTLRDMNIYCIDAIRQLLTATCNRHAKSTLAIYSIDSTNICFT